MTDIYTRGDPDAPHLFPSRGHGSNSLSVQGDMAGYGCLPRKRLADIRLYDAVEVTVHGPEGRVDPRKCPAFDPGLRHLFDHVDGVGSQVSQDDLVRLEDHLRALASAGTALVERRHDDVPGLDDDEVLGLLAGIDAAVFAGQWPRGDAQASAVGKLLSAAANRSLDVTGLENLADATAPDGPSP